MSKRSRSKKTPSAPSAIVTAAHPVGPEPIVSFFKKIGPLSYGLVLACVSALTWGSTLNYDFAWDDYELIVENPNVQSSSAWGEPFNKPLFRSKGRSYRPLQTVTYKANRLLGAKGPAPYRAVNILLHTANAWFCFLLFRLLGAHPVASFFVPLLFLIHPLNVAAITFIAGRADPLSLFFLFAATVAAVRWLQKGPLTATGSVGLTVLYACALFSRESAILFPCLAAGWLAPTLGDLRPKIRKLWPLAAAALAGYLLLRLRAFAAFPPDTQTAPELSLRLLVLPHIWLQYLRQLFLFPAPSMEYRLTVQEAQTGLYLLKWLALLPVLAWGWFLTKKDPFTKGAFLFCILSLLQVSNLFTNLNASMADHWLYIPQIGFFAMIVHYAAVRLEQKHRLKTFIALLTLFSIFLAYRTADYNALWKNEKSLYEGLAARGASNSRVLYNAANIRFIQGDLDGALKLAEDSVARGPRDDALALCATLYMKRGQTEKAITALEHSLRLNDKTPELWSNLGGLYILKKDKAGALRCLRKALALDPKLGLALQNLKAAEALQD